MPRANNNGIEIEFDTIGDPQDEPLLLVMGFTAQLIAWDEKLCQLLADKGFFVIRYDNRDCGLSSHLDGVAVDMAELFNARSSGAAVPPVPYTLSDMAADGMAVLDALGIDRAHVVGASMGGMIVQTMAIEHPQRLRTMTSIMSTTGEPDYGQAAPEAMAALMRPPPLDRAEAHRGLGRRLEDLQQPALLRRGGSARSGPQPRSTERSTPRAPAARWARSSRAATEPTACRNVRLPFLVIHGRADTLIGLSGGERTAELVPGANLVVLNDMGHDLPEPLWPFIVDTIASHATHAIG